MADLHHVQRVAALYLLWRRDQRRSRRRFWIHPVLQRRAEYGEFHHLLQELRLDDDRFQRYFRLSLAQFDELLSRVGARITLQDTNYRRSIPAAERLSICLRYLATGDSFRTIADSFRVGASTVCKIVPQVVTAIWDCLVDEFKAVPTTEDWRSMAEEFQQRWNFLLCYGAVNGKHVDIKAPAHSDSQYFNYHGNLSIVLLAVVDAQYRFRVIDVGAYGRTSDRGTLANSAFGRALRAGSLHLPPDQHLPGAEYRGPQPHVFVADEAFPLRRNMMRPFPGRSLPPDMRVFNYRLSRARLVVEDAFGILSAQWRVYRRLIEVHPEVVEQCVKATCVLHNFMRATRRRDAPVVMPLVPGEDPLQPLHRVGANNASQEAVRVRETFRDYFTAEGAVPWQPTE